MDSEQINQGDNQPNETYDTWKNLANEITNEGKEDLTSETLENNNNEISQNKENELPQQSTEWHKEHTEESIDKELSEDDLFWREHVDLYEEAKKMGAPLDIEGFRTQKFKIVEDENNTLHIWAPTPEYKKWLNEDQANRSPYFKGTKYEDLQDMKLREALDNQPEEQAKYNDPEYYYKMGAFHSLSNGDTSFDPSKILTTGYYLTDKYRDRKINGGNPWTKELWSDQEHAISDSAKKGEGIMKTVFTDEKIKEMGKGAIEEAIRKGAVSWKEWLNRRYAYRYSEFMFSDRFTSEEGKEELKGLLDRFDVDLDDPALVSESLSGLKNIAETNGRFDYKHHTERGTKDGWIAQVHPEKMINLYMDLFDYEKHHKIAELYRIITDSNNNGDYKLKQLIKERPEFVRYEETANASQDKTNSELNN